MAFCLSRAFRSCSSFAYIGRRALHADSSRVNTKKSMGSLLEEVKVGENGECRANWCSNEKLMLRLECKAYRQVEKVAEDYPKRPDKAQLQYVTDVLIEDLPQLFNRNMNYKIYHRNMVFENNIRGTKTVGLVNYMREMFMLKIIGNIRFSNVRLSILRITNHPEDGTVRVRWRIVGVSQLKNILRMLKQVSPKSPEPEGWYDGFSIFQVKSDGLVHRHIVDKMIPESDEGEKVTSLRNPLAAKMAFAMGLSRKELSVAQVSYEDGHPKSPCSSKLIYSLQLDRPALKLKFSDSSDLNKSNHPQ